MILFIAHYPASHNEQDGMIQRISAVDRIFKNEKRIYAQISTDSNEEDFISEDLSIYKINFNKNIDKKRLYNLVLQANIIYVHSIYNGQYILPFYKYKKVITDLHGVVPEEEAYLGDPHSANYFNNIENFIIYNSYLIINVTESMAKHLKNKYPDMTARMITLPILDNYQINKENKIKKNNKDRMTVIYSGGSHRWQNIDLMLSSIIKIKDKYSFIMLSKDINAIQSKINEYALENIVELKSVPRKTIDEYYYKSDFGFILRDDIVINNVACPTKLTEYLAYGIIPIIIQPDIGDFKEAGYSYITLDDFIKGNLPSIQKMEELRINNYKVIEQLKTRFNSSIKELLGVYAESLSNTTSELYLTEDEIIHHGLKAYLFIDTGSGFNEQQSVDIYGYESLLEFNINQYKNLKRLRFKPLNNKVVVKITEINFITENNILCNNIICHDNAIYKKDNLFIFETDDPIIEISVKDTSKTVKVSIKLRYIALGIDVYKYICEEKSIIIQRKEEEIRKKERGLIEKEERINKLLEKEIKLDNIYSSTGWQLLTGYYKVRDFLLPQNSVRRKLAGFILNFMCGLIKRLNYLNIVCDIIDIYPDSVNISGWAISPNGIDRIDIYLDTILLGSACYGQERPDVEKVFPHIKDSRYSGFQFNQTLHKLYQTGSNHTVKIIGRDKKGLIKELLISAVTKESILPDRQTL